MRVSACEGIAPALDKLVKDAKRRRFDVLVVWKLDRLGATSAISFSCSMNSPRWVSRSSR